MKARIPLIIRIAVRFLPEPWKTIVGLVLQIISDVGVEKHAELYRLARFRTEGEFLEGLSKMSAEVK